MNTAFLLAPGPWTSLVGAVLFHFLWQGTLLAGGLALALLVLRERSATARHACSCATLAAMVFSPMITLIWILSTSVVSAPFSAELPATPTGLQPSGAIPTGINAPWTWTPWIAWAWLLGVLILGTRLLGGWWRVHRITTQHAHPISSEWQARLVELQASLGVTRAVRLLESARVHGPIVVGWLRPVILIPLGLTGQLPPAQIEALLLHELAHIRGGDFLMNLFQRFAETVLFYHPAVWWVSAQIDREREHRCDDWVRHTQGDGRALAGALISLLETSGSAPALALAADGGSVTDRVRRLLGAPASVASARSKSWLRILLALVLLTVGMWAWPWISAPTLYVSTARIQLITPEDSLRFDPYSVQTQLEKLNSNRVLQDVIDTHKLREKWGLNPAQSLERLRSRLKVAQLRNTPLLEIRVASEEGSEAASLANAIADRAQALAAEDGQHLRSKAAETTDRRRSYLDRLHAELRHNLARPELEAADRRYLEKQREMVEGLRLEEERKSILATLDASMAAKARPQLEIVDRAIPSLRRSRWTAGAL